jgi:hypothetical protein
MPEQDPTFEKIVNILFLYSGGAQPRRRMEERPQRAGKAI